MCEFTIEFWRRVMDAPIVGFEAAVIKEGYMPSTVFRVRLESQDEATPREVILKCVRPPWNPDPDGASREYYVYSDLLTQIPMPQARRYHTQLADGYRHTQIIMQDLTRDYVFYPETHAWTWVEAQAILKSLAQLHSAGESLKVAERSYLMPPLCTRWTPARAREMIADLECTPWLQQRMRPAVKAAAIVLDELPELEHIASCEPLTVVHYDVYPPNVALCRDPDKSEAVLIDWAAATADIAEIDLAFLFQQPFESDRLLDWRTALRWYWEERERITGAQYDWAERCAVFRYARIEALFTTLLAIHRARDKCIREGTRFTPDSPDVYTRFFNAALDDFISTVQEMVEDPLA